MEIKGQKLLKVSAILMIIFGALAMVVALLSLIGGSWVSSLAGVVGDSAEAVGAFAAGGILMVLGLVMAVSAGLEIATGIVGVKAASTPSVGKIKAALILDLIIIIVSLINFCYNLFTGGYGDDPIWMVILGVVCTFIIPVLFLIGIIKYKNGLLELMGGAAE